MMTIDRSQIKCVTRRGARGAEADFSATINARPWLCCKAAVWPSLPFAQINSRAISMSIEEASAVSLALQMAVEWIAEELVKEKQP